MYFAYWISRYLDSRAERSSPLRFVPLESHARWIFALLARVDLFCTADEMNNLRGLARACISLVRARRQDALQDERPVSGPSGHGTSVKATVAATNSGVSSEPPLGVAADVSTSKSGTKAMSEVSCWMTVSAIVIIWGQRDLWGDAEEALRQVLKP